MRKLLQLASASMSLIADATSALGVRSNPEEISTTVARAVTVEFPADRQWVVACRSQQLLHVEAGEARLPGEPINFEQFKDQVECLFVASANLDAHALWQIFRATLQMGRGNMVVIASDAAEEAARLSKEGTKIEPILQQNSYSNRPAGSTELSWSMFEVIARQLGSS